MSQGVINDGSKQRKIGVVLSYILLAMNMAIGITLTPLIVDQLGDSEYGLYQTIASFANNLALLDFGIGTTIMRYLSKYREKKDEEKVNTTLYIILLQTILMSIVIIALGIVLKSYLPVMYSKTLERDEIQRAKILFIILVFNVGISLFDHYFVGINSAYEQFFFVNGAKILKILLRIFLITTMITNKATVITLALIDLSLTMVFAIIDSFYAFIKLKICIRYCKIEKMFLLEILMFNLTIFLQAFVNQINTNVDKVILGMMTTIQIVAVYSVAMQIFGIFNSLASVISGVYLPHITRIIQNRREDEDTSDLIIGPGRVQFMLMGLVLVGFVFVGKDFINLWMGSNYLEAWVITLIIMVPSMIELIENVAISVTLAKGKNAIRTLIIACASIFNIIITIVLINILGYIGAPIATALSYIFGYIITVNIFYVKVVHIDVIKMFEGIFNGIWICLSLTALASIPMISFSATNYMLLILKALYISTIYIILLYFIGLSKEEKTRVKSIFSKINNKV